MIHFTVSLILSFMAMNFFQITSFKPELCTYMTVFGLGIAKELIDFMVYRHFSFGDLLMDFLGVLTGIMIVYIMDYMAKILNRRRR